MSNGTITMTGAEYDALADRIATLEAENAKLRAELERRAVPESWRRMDASFVIEHIRQTSVFDADLIEQMLEYAINAAAPSAPKADERPLYTCIGKGGEYRYLGTAIGAGDSRGELAEVYQDRTGQLFHRTPEDFMERMEPIAAARQEGGKV